jgi:CheY-like chemotaxis protein
MALDSPPLVLLIDDDDAMRSLLSDAFERRGFEVLGLTDGRAALRYVAALAAGVSSVRRPCVIVSDVYLPGATGIDLLEEAGALQPPIPMVLITSFGDPGVRHQATLLGAAAFLEKPLVVSALVDLVAGLPGARAA